MTRALPVKEAVEASQKATAEPGGPSGHGGDVTAEDVFGEKTVDQHVRFHPTQDDRQGKDVLGTWIHNINVLWFGISNMFPPGEGRMQP